ncbi:MAG: flagellin FliC [Burkholderiaceae bacterium]|nr:flagellin FliC [Burkholderiaceae bacterium]
MAQIINTNLMSLNAQRNLNTTQGALATAVQRLSSGLRVNSAKDDAAGLAIAERMNSQIRGMNVGIRNANDAISLAQTAEGALGKIGDMAQRMRELAVQSANATNTDEDRAALDAEYQQLSAEITRTMDGTKFNGTAVLTATTDLTFQIGAGTDATDTIDVTAPGTDLSAAVGALTADITSVAGATGAMDTLDALITEVNTQRANFGAVQNRFEAVIATSEVAVENQAAARSRIMDADFAAETASLTRAQVLQQAGTAMLSQANSLPNNVLSLLR